MSVRGAYGVRGGAERAKGAGNEGGKDGVTTGGCKAGDPDPAEELDGRSEGDEERR